MTQIFISHPTPFNDIQKSFMALLEEELRLHDLKAVNLGKNNWSFKSPMQPIKKLVNESRAAVIIGLERYHDYIGYSKQNSALESEYIHRYRSSSWIQIEAGMAYMAGIPILILKDKCVEKDGILDPNVSEFYVFEFNLETESKQLSPELRAIIEDWSKHILEI